MDQLKVLRTMYLRENVNGQIFKVRYGEVKDLRVLNSASGMNSSARTHTDGFFVNTFGKAKSG